MTLQDIPLVWSRLLTAWRLAGNLSVGGNLAVDGSISAGGGPLGAPSTPQPADHGLIAWSGQPDTSTTTSSAAVSGTLYLRRIPIRSSVPVSKVWWINSAAGSGATAGQNFVAAIRSDGTVLSTGGIDSVATLSGPQSGTLATPQTVTSWFWAALLINATSPPSIARAAGLSATGNNVGLSAATYAYAVNGTGLTAVPASITPASNTLTGGMALWMGAS
jgi:hypothetical protein